MKSDLIKERQRNCSWSGGKEKQEMKPQDLDGR